jgi:phospholipid-binding lipoprotein MlaA
MPCSRLSGELSLTPNNQIAGSKFMNKHPHFPSRQPAIWFTMLGLALVSLCSVPTICSASTIVSSSDSKSPVSAMKSGAPLSKNESDPGDDYANVATIADPLEPVNRGTFWVNHQIYHYLFHPVCKTYKTVLPRPVRTGIFNVFDNLEFPVRFVNDLLQLKVKRAGLETEKFVVNSTAGVAGIMKVSSKIPYLADVPKTDTCTTFAKWKIPQGPYVVWPILGPKSLRDTVGWAGDVALDPVSWIGYGLIGGATGAWTIAVSAPDTARNVNDKLDTYETLTRTSLDRYLAIRSAYCQNRKKIESN